MHLEIGFREHDCAQVILLNPCTIGKCSLERNHPILTELVSIMNSYFVQYKATLVKDVIVAQQIDSLAKSNW